jgi:hypothetical protein
MNVPRPVQRVLTPLATIDGAGVRLRRSIATPQLDYLDPFLLFDHLGSEDPDDYLAGFPMHPHRGIETVTYVRAGLVNHRDSLGHSGSIGPGDLQWMTAGSGIMHEEMPQRIGGRLDGFQLWVNLPARLKMTEPRYQEFPASTMPTVVDDQGTVVRVIAGRVGEVHGPVTQIAAAPTCLDVTVPAGGRLVQGVEPSHTTFAYVYEGEGCFGVGDGKQAVTATCLVVFGDGDSVFAGGGAAQLGFLLISGQPLHEPVARHGPFVMNTAAEIREALNDLRNDTFIRRPDRR